MNIGLHVSFWISVFIFFGYIPRRGGFPDSSVGKESSCNAGDPNTIPGSGRSAGERIGYPPQYSWASLVSQLVNNPPAIQETLGLIPGLWRSPGEGNCYPLQYSGLENSMDLYSPWGRKESDTTEWFSFFFLGIWDSKRGYISINHWYIFLLLSKFWYNFYLTSETSSGKNFNSVNFFIAIDDFI